MRPRFLLLGVLGLQVSAQNETLTLDIVSSQINDFLQSSQIGELSPRDANSKPLSSCALACSFLDFALPGQVSHPESPIYQSQETQYFSEFQSSQQPVCRFSPLNSLGVSLAVLTVQVTQCKFAVKSGGHGYFAGASNIDGGLTIDLVKLKTISISRDQTQTSVGTGNKWLNVYSALEPKGLSVVGGRVADIGTGGLTLGGGISFFSARYGWACDNVNTYEVVFADGSIREVSRTTYPDLYFALRGGGNNFGIVTRLDLATFPQGDLWTGSFTYLYSQETADALAKAVYWLNVNTPSDPFAQAILPFAYVQSLNTWALAPDIQYGKPVEYPPILSNFTNIPGSLVSDIGVTKLTAKTISLNASSPGGFRQTWWAMAVKNSPTIIQTIMDIAMEETKPILNFTDMVPAVVFQPISASVISHFSKNGGNALGITAADGPLILVDIAIMWSTASDDEAVFAAAARFINRANETAYAQGLGHPYIYENYAAIQQPVFQGYGQKNLAKLRAASKKYDPTGVWQKLQPGFFKLF